jgi:hypothetical protein
MSGHRQSALLLHGLDRADQRWIMARLGQADARILDGHLAELRQLGIPADPALAARRGDGDGAEAVVRGASAAAIALLLADEPVWMVRQVLALGDWPWRDAYLAGLGQHQRERLAAGVPIPALAGQAGAELLAALATRLAGPVPTRAAPEAPPAGPLQSLRLALGRWL